MDFAYENGMNALALTDHGNANGLAYQVLHAKKMMADGKSSNQFLVVKHISYQASQTGRLITKRCKRRDKEQKH